MYEDVLALLHKTNVSYEKFEHEPVLDYETIGLYVRDSAYKALQVKAYF